MKLEERTKANEARRGTTEAHQQQHYEASLDMGPTSASPRGRGHGLTLTLGVYVADVERDSVADGVITVGDRVVKVGRYTFRFLWMALNKCHTYSTLR